MPNQDLRKAWSTYATLVSTVMSLEGQFLNWKEGLIPDIQFTATTQKKIEAIKALYPDLRAMNNLQTRTAANSDINLHADSCACEGLCFGHVVPERFATKFSKRIWRQSNGVWNLVENRNDGRGDVDIFLFQER